MDRTVGIERQLERVLERLESAPQIDRRTFITGAIGAGALAALPLDGALAAAAKPPVGGTLRLGVIGASTESYNLLTNIGIIDVVRNTEVYDSLGGPKPNDPKIRPALAESWEPNKKRNQWKVKLRPGVEFHNGKSITPEDVINSYQHFKLGRGAAQIQLIDLPNTHKLDKHTILFQLTEPYGLFETLLGVKIFPADQTTFTSTNIVGSGPFKVDQISPGQLTVLSRFAHYWDSPRPYLKGLQLVSFSDSTAKVNALVAGQVDAIDDVQPTQFAQIASAGKKILRGVGGTWTPMVMDVTQDPFKDNRVRLAMKLIANRPQLVRNAYGGLGTIGDDYWGAGEPQYPVPGKLIPQRHQDIAQAKSLLKKAGQQNLTVTLETADIALGALASSLIFAQAATAAGVTVNVHTNPANTYYSGPYLKAPFYVSNWGPHTVENQSAQCIEGGYLETHWQNAKYVSLIKKARLTTSDKTRLQLYTEAQTLLSDQGGYIIWGFQNSLDAYDPKFTGFASKVAARAFGGYDFRAVYHK